MFNPFCQFVFSTNLSKKTFFLVFTFAFLLLKTTYAQVTDSTEVVDQTIEAAIEALDPETNPNIEELAEYLQQLAEQPLNINTASVEDLTKIPGISFVLAQEIVNYRKTKPFEAVQELLKVKRLGNATFTKIRPYVTIGSTAQVQKALLMNSNYWFNKSKVEHISRMVRTVQAQEGFKEDGKYLGDPFKIYQRTSYTSDHASVNLTLEKDPGETWNLPLGYDFTSFHVAAQKIGYLNNLVIGDYSLSFGQGLVLWNGGMFGKGQDVIKAVTRSERGVKEYRSTLESGFQRGVAVSMGETFETSLFFSTKNETASLVSGDTIRFPGGSGLNRTQTEIDRRYNAPIQLMGGRFRWKFGTGWIGTTAYQFHSDKYIKRATSTYNQYDFEGNTFRAGGLDYTYYWQTILLSGELGISQNNARAWIQSAQWIINESTEFSLAIRNYDKAYQSPFAAGFGEGSGGKNEFGIYTGLSQKMSPNWNLKVYFDQFQFPFARFGVSQASKGYDALLASEYSFDPKTQLTVLSRYKIKEGERDALLDGRTYKVLDEQKRWSLRTDLSHQVLANLRLRFRIEYARYEDFDQKDNGWQIYQDVRWNITKKLQADFRLTYFDTDSFDSRLYQYENDVLYNMSNPMLSGQGKRSFLLLKYTPDKRWDIWFKYDISVYENVSSVGSGNDLINGNTRSRITTQVRYVFN